MGEQAVALAKAVKYNSAGGYEKLNTVQCIHLSVDL